jgi:hypothetical protein
MAWSFSGSRSEKLTKERAVCIISATSIDFGKEKRRMLRILERRARRIRPACFIDNLNLRAMKGNAGCELVDREEVPEAESASRRRAVK